MKFALSLSAGAAIIALLVPVADAQQVPEAAAAAASASRPLPCRAFPYGDKYALVTNGPARCQAGAPLKVWGLRIEELTQRVCDFSKSVNVTKAQSFHDVDTVMCVFTGEVLEGSIPVMYGQQDPQTWKVTPLP